MATHSRSGGPELQSGPSRTAGGGLVPGREIVTIVAVTEAWDGVSTSFRSWTGVAP